MENGGAGIDVGDARVGSGIVGAEVIELWVNMIDGRPVDGK